MTRDQCIEAISEAIHDAYFATEHPKSERPSAEDLWRIKATAAYDAMADHFRAGERIRHYLTRMDDELLARDGSAELSHDEAKQALRDVYLLSRGDEPEHHPLRIRALDIGGEND